MKTILLTGGSGFIGKNIRESYLSDKYCILAPSSKELNCFDEDAVDDFFRNNKIDIVIHSAGKPGHRNAIDINNLFYTNTKMFLNLEKHHNKYEKMLIAGSGAIYDMRYYQPKMKENYFGAHIPVDEHGLCKYACGKIVEKSDNIIDLRIFGIFGKYEDYAIRFISNAICKTLFGLPITIKQDRKFDYLYIDDLMPILEFFIENHTQHKAYNITPDKSVYLSELAAAIKNISGKNIPVHIAQSGNGLEYSGDNSRLREEYKKIKFTPLQNAILDLYNWYAARKNTLNQPLLLSDK